MSVIGLDRLQVGMCHYGTYPFVFVSALRIDPTCVLQVFCLKRRISLIIAVVNPLYKDLAAMYSFLSCSVAHSVIPSAAGLAFSRRT